MTDTEVQNTQLESEQGFEHLFEKQQVKIQFNHYKYSKIETQIPSVLQQSCQNLNLREDIKLNISHLQVPTKKISTIISSASSAKMGSFSDNQSERDQTELPQTLNNFQTQRSSSPKPLKGRQLELNQNYKKSDRNEFGPKRQLFQRRQNVGKSAMSERNSKSQESLSNKLTDEQEFLNNNYPVHPTIEIEDDIVCLRLERQKCVLNLDKIQNDDFDFAGSVDLLSSPVDSRNSKASKHFLNIKGVQNFDNSISKLKEQCHLENDNVDYHMDELKLTNTNKTDKNIFMKLKVDVLSDFQDSTEILESNQEQISAPQPEQTNNNQNQKQKFELGQTQYDISLNLLDNNKNFDKSIEKVTQLETAIDNQVNNADSKVTYQLSDSEFNSKTELGNQFTVTFCIAVTVMSVITYLMKCVNSEVDLTQ